LHTHQIPGTSPEDGVDTATTTTAEIYDNSESQQLTTFTISVLLGSHNNDNDFSRFLRLQAHIFQARTVKFGMTVRTWDSRHQAKFCKKNRSRGYTPFGQIYNLKNTNFGDFGGCRPTF